MKGRTIVKSPSQGFTEERTEGGAALRGSVAREGVTAAWPGDQEGAGHTETGGEGNGATHAGTYLVDPV